MKKANGKNKKLLFGLAVSLVLAMAVGSFALGEAQTPVTPQAAATNDGDTGAFNVEGGTYGETEDYHFVGETEDNAVLYIHPKSSETNITIKNKDPKTETDDAIEITAGPSDTEKSVNITLAGVNINTRITTGEDRAALKIKDDATFNVNIFLADDSENYLTGESSLCAGLEKSGNDDKVGMLTIGVPDKSDGTGQLTANGGSQVAGIGSHGGANKNTRNITISGGKVIANGGNEGAGIGGGIGEEASYIYITGGVVEATGGYYGAGIGGGHRRAGSHIYITGGVVTAKGGDYGAGIGGGFNDNLSDKSGSDINISGGVVKAYGGEGAAGIGGGVCGCGSNITISGGVVEAYAGKGNNDTDDSPGIGAGASGSVSGSSTGNSIKGNAVVKVTSASTQVNALRDCDVDNGIVFTGVGTNFDSTTGNVTDFTWNGSEMNGNVSLIQDVEIPSGLTIPDGQILSIDRDPKDTKGEKTVNISGKDGAELTIEGELRNNWKVNLPSNLAFDGEGKVTTKTDFYREGSTTVYKTGYQTYQTSEGVQKYKDLPNPDDTTLLKNSLNSDKFIYWYYLNGSTEVKIDNSKDVEPNQHDFYEKRATAYAVTIPTLENGSVTSDVAEAYSGDTVTLTVTPAEGYQLQANSLKVMAGTTVVTVTDKGDGKYTFTMPEAAVTVSAAFEGTSHEVTIDQPEHGTVTVNPEKPKTGDEVTITLKPDEGYKPGGAPVVKDEDGNEIELTPTGNPNEYKFIMPNSDLTVDVNFVPDPTPTPPEPTPEPTPDPSVNPDGSGSGASSKTGDPFMGGVALALLGVATTGAVLVRKRK